MLNDNLIKIILLILLNFRRRSNIYYLYDIVVYEQLQLQRFYGIQIRRVAGAGERSGIIYENKKIKKGKEKKKQFYLHNYIDFDRVSGVGHGITARRAAASPYTDNNIVGRTSR